MDRLRIIDSHTGGEPTRVVIDGGPDLGGEPIAERLARLRDEHDELRRAVILEPRGSEVLVGALLCEPSDPTCAAGVIFFNNAGYLKMCGHGTIGLVVTLAHLGRIEPGIVRIETPVGIVEATWEGGDDVSIVNVPSYRQAAGVRLEVPGHGIVHGDVAWGGNWFFLTKEHGAPLEGSRIAQLTDLAWRIREAVNAGGFAEVDHIELLGPPQAGGDARGFVLCPGKAYDRSPCGTGTSAKLACLAAEGTLAEGAPWVQESIIGSRFHGSYRWLDQSRGIIAPTIRGSAFITAETTLLLRPDDPFRFGIS